MLWVNQGANLGLRVRRQAAKLAAGGERPEGFPEGNFVQPTVGVEVDGTVWTMLFWIDVLAQGH